MASAERAAYLDRRVNSLSTVGVTAAYSAITGLTTWTLPYSVDPMGYDGVLVAVQEYPGTLLTTTRPAANQIAAVGNFTAVGVLIGILYSTTNRLSTLYLRDPRTDVPETRGRLQVRFLTLNYDNSTDFTVTVTTTDGRTSTYVFASTTAKSGKFIVPVQAKNDTVKITISCSQPGACNIASYEWEGLIYVRDRLR